MANNSKIVITAGLQVPETVHNIQNELDKQVAPNLKLEIACNINTSNLSQIQTQLNEMSKGLSVNVNTSNIQQSINQAVKAEPVKINVTADINKDELQRQAREIEKALSLQYPKGQTDQLRGELKALLTDYQKAISSNNLSGMETAIEKIADFAGSYRKEIEIINEELKYQQDRTREILKEQEKLYITAEQYAALQREVSKDGRTATQVLNSSIGVGKWSTDITKFNPNNLPYWSKFADEVNNINPLRDAIINEGDIVRGINDLNQFLGKSVDMTSQYLKANEQTWVEWRDIVHDAVSVARGEGSSLSNEFVNLLGFEDFSLAERNVATIATTYGEGAKQSEILHQKQERLQQDYDILVAKIQKTKLALDTLATRDGTNYNEVFTGIMSGQVVDEASLNRARDALSAIRKEFQLANAQMTSDIPQNAIENFIQRIAKADSQIKILAVDYQKLNNPPQALMDSFQKLQELAKGFNFSTDFKGESKESINARIQAYTQIKVALNETQSLLQSAQKEESLLAKEEENFAKKLEAHNREILNRINLKESEIQKERELSETQARRIRETNEAEMGRYWQGRFEESVKGMTAENEELKKMRQYYADMAKEIEHKENAFNREFERELKNEERLEAEQQKRLETARQLREEQQHSYWQGRFDESIKGMTAENTVLKEMREYYEQVNKEAEKLNRTQSQDNNKALQETNKLIKDNLSALEKFNNSTVAKNNASNPTVVSQTGLNADLINQLRGLQESLANDRSPENIARITAKVNELDGSLKDATARSAELSRSLKDESSAAKLESDIRNLTNRVETFANTNKRATESLKLMRNGVTFADEWKRITEQLKSGNLDDNAIRRLSNDLRNFQAEARNANLTTSKFFTDMGSQLKMLVTRWLSLYAVIGRVTSALNDLKEVDKILTEIAKSSDVTRESLEELGNAAFETANQYGRTAADYLYGVQEFSRAGFRGDQLTGLTEVSLLAQSAGDIETDLANSYVIATNAAYGYKGSVEELTEVLDRQNYVTNNYALNMTDLANATKIAASQAAQSGVEIDEMTAALATMISSTQQGGEIASRALRGILMNIQQVKGEVGDGEEDITAESLSKYEKAAANLGVALKEVKDGVVVLRDPMQVLNDLAVAFNKESDDSIKKAELINAVGGN